MVALVGWPFVVVSVHCICCVLASAFNHKIKGEVLAPVKCLLSPRGFGFCGSVDVD